VSPDLCEICERPLRDGFCVNGDCPRFDPRPDVEELCDTPEVWHCTVEDLGDLARAYLWQLKLETPDPDDFEITLDLTEEVR
jgi:hypothetical protein